MPKTKTKPSKRQATRAAIASREPEVLGDDTHDGVREPLLDVVEDLLSRANEFTMPARLVIQEAFGGKCDAAREVEVLKMVKRDARFEILAGVAGAPNRLRLRSTREESEAVAEALDAAKAAAAESPANNPTADPTAPAATPTLGDHLAAAQSRPQRIAWKHDIGSSVLLLTDGYPPRRAIIRNIADHGSFALYDLNLDNGGQTNEVPAYRIGRDLDAEGEIAALRQHCALIERHLARGKDMAQRYVEKQAEERKLADHLSKFRKGIDELAQQIAEHNRTDPGQMELDDAIRAAESARPPRVERMDGEPTDAEDVLAERGLTALPMASPVDLEQLHAARVDRATASTGKPPKVKPVAVLEGHQHVLADVQDSVAVLLPVVGADIWAQRYQDAFGNALELPSTPQPAELARGGALCGMPVKVGRKTLWIGPERDAVLVRLPEPEPRAVGKDAAAGG